MVNNNKKLIYIICGAILIGFIAFFSFKMISGNKEESSNDVVSTNAFFLKNKDSKYALFDDEGNKLTDFEFDRVGKFVNDNAKVTKGEKVGVISSSGKMTVDFGKYKNIDPVGGIYKVRGEKYDYTLIDGQGNKLFDLEDKDTKNFIEINLTLLLDKKEETYTILDRHGKTITSFAYDEDADSPKANEVDDVVAIHYNGKIYVLDQQKGELITKFNSDTVYGVARVFPDKDMIVLGTSSGEGNKIIEKGKLVEFDSACKRLRLDENENILCEVDGKKFFLDEKYKKQDSSYLTAYYNNKSYVKNNEKTFGGVDFYKNGKLVKNVPCRKISEVGPMYHELYVLGTYSSTTCNTKAGYYEIYNANGEKAIDQTFMKVEPFDKNGYAIVSEDRTDFYLIDKKGKKVSKKYDKIMSSKGYYVTVKNNQRGILDKKGKEIIPTKYDRIEHYNIHGNDYISLKDEKQNTIVYNMKENKEVFSAKGVFQFGKDYIKVSEKGNTKYYSYKSGKMMYKESN